MLEQFSKQQVKASVYILVIVWSYWIDVNEHSSIRDVIAVNMELYYIGAWWFYP